MPECRSKRWCACLYTRIWKKREKTTDLLSYTIKLTTFIRKADVLAIPHTYNYFVAYLGSLKQPCKAADCSVVRLLQSISTFWHVYNKLSLKMAFRRSCSCNVNRQKDGKNMSKSCLETKRNFLNGETGYFRRAALSPGLLRHTFLNAVPNYYN